MQASLKTEIGADLVSAVMARLGKRGGSRRTPKQEASARKNVLKAQAARRKKAA